MSKTSNQLPQGFSDLEAFLHQWSLPDSKTRSAARQAASMSQIQTFYDAMRASAPSALEHLSSVGLGDMDVADQNLLRLCLSFAEIAPAVEWFGQVTVTEGMDIKRIEMQRIIPDTQAQS